MGRWILAALVFMLSVGGTVRAGGALGLWEVPDFSGASKPTLDECLEEGRSKLQSAFAGMEVSPAGAGLPSARLREAIRPLCEELVRRSETASLTQETGPRFVSRLIRENPSLATPLCRAGIDAELAANADLYRYLGKKERARLRRDTCRLQVQYMSTERPVIDYAALIGDHPALFVLACGAVLQADLARNAAFRARFSDPSLRRIGRRSCREGLRLGIIDTAGAQSLLDTRVDEHAFNRLIDRVAEDEARG